MLKRTISKGMQNINQPRSVESSNESAIMYDPLNQTLFQGSLKALNSENHIEIPIKNCSTKVDIRIPLRAPSSSSQGRQKQDGEELGIYLATVDLRLLGRSVKNGVRNGTIKNVYVLGHVPDRLMLDPSAEDTDEE